MLESDDPGSLLEVTRRQLERIEVDLAVAQRLRVRLQRVAEVLERGLGLLLATCRVPDRHRAWLRRIENELMDVGSDLSTPPDPSGRGLRPRIDEGYVVWIEEACDEVNSAIDDLGSFVLWFGRPAAAHLDVCRTICRKAERRVLEIEEVNPQIVRYLNRLSDLLFILSRAAAEGDETLWEPGRGAELAEEPA